MKDTKLTPRITETAKGLWAVYFGMTVACVVGLRLAGMTWLDALMHAFSTMGLGGFSSHDASFGYWDSPRDRGGGHRLHARGEPQLRDALPRGATALRSCPTRGIRKRGW